MLSSAAGRAAPANTQKRSKNHVCAYRGCGKAFDRSSTLEKHARVHTGESIASSRCLLHMCTCVHLDQADAQTFKQSSNLNTHARAHRWANSRLLFHPLLNSTPSPLTRPATTLTAVAHDRLDACRVTLTPTLTFRPSRPTALLAGALR